MPGLMVLAIILVVIAAIAGVVAVVSGRSYKSSSNANTKFTRNIARGIAAFGIVVAGLMTVFSSLTTIPAKEIGVVTTFGRPTGEVGNGLHWVNPFSSVTTLDGALQNDQLLSLTACTQVRLGNMSTACVENAVQWQINAGSADELYRNYRDFTKIRSNLVDNNLRVELNTAFSTYDPLASLANQVSQGVQTPTAGSTDELDAIATKVQTDLQKDVGAQITIIKVSVTIVHFDASTETKIQLFQSALADTRIAKQKEQTAAAQAAAAEALAAKLGNSPTNVLVSKCLDSLDEMVQKGQIVPGGFNCWPGANSGILVGAK